MGAIPEDIDSYFNRITGGSGGVEQICKTDFNRITVVPVSVEQICKTESLSLRRRVYGDAHLGLATIEMHGEWPHAYTGYTSGVNQSSYFLSPDAAREMLLALMSMLGIEDDVIKLVDAEYATKISMIETKC